MRNYRKKRANIEVNLHTMITLLAIALFFGYLVGDWSGRVQAHSMEENFEKYNTKEGERNAWNRYEDRR